jgi:hypothetical protein
MTRSGLGLALLVTVGLVAIACGQDGNSGDSVGGGSGDIGVDAASLIPEVDHPYVAFAQVTKTVHEGEEIDGGETLKLRVESEVLSSTKTVGGVEVTVVKVTEYEDGDLIEITEDYYAQDAEGIVYYLGERVDEYEDGEVTGHGGAWLAGKGENLVGVFMPADPAEGDVFEQERAPGVAEDRSEVVATGITVTVPAGTFEDCIETEDLDPIDDVTETKFYCPGVGLVREVSAKGDTLDLIEFSKA